MEQELNVGEVLQARLKTKVRNLRALKEEAREIAENARHGDFADISRKESEGDFIALRMKKLSEEITKIEAAIARYKKDPENYGICEQCGETICPARLIAWPETRHCVPCKNNIERESPQRIQMPAYRSA